MPCLVVPFLGPIMGLTFRSNKILLNGHPVRRVVKEKVPLEILFSSVNIMSISQSGPLCVAQLNEKGKWMRWAPLSLGLPLLELSQ